MRLEATQRDVLALIPKPYCRRFRILPGFAYEALGRAWYLVNH